MNKLSVTLGVLLVAVLSYFGGQQLGKPISQNLGSVQRSNEYFSTTTARGLPATRYKIASSTAVLGSVVISSSSAAQMWVYNWDGVGEMTASGTLVAFFPVNATVGTYTYDILLNKGLYVSTTAAFTGNYTVIYRNNY